MLFVIAVNLMTFIYDGSLNDHVSGTENQIKRVGLLYIYPLIKSFHI